MPGPRVSICTVRGDMHPQGSRDIGGGFECGEDAQGSDEMPRPSVRSQALHPQHHELKSAPGTPGVVTRGRKSLPSGSLCPVESCEGRGMEEQCVP